MTPLPTSPRIVCVAKAFDGDLSAHSRVFFAYFAIFTLQRLVGEAAVARVQRLSVGVDRRETLAIWMFVSRREAEASPKPAPQVTEHEAAAAGVAIITS